MMNTDLTATRQRAEGATPGPWVVLAMGEHGYPQRVSNGAAILIAELYESPDRLAANAEFIAHARTDIPDLLDRIRGLERALVTAQWGGMDSWYQDEVHEACPECEGVDPAEWPDATSRKIKPQLGHRDDCSIGIALSGIQP